MRSDGSVWEWRGNLFGQVACGGSNIQVPTAVNGLSAVVAVSVGDRHCLALKADGSVWAWGHNQYGQLGVEALSQRTTPEPVPGLPNIGAIWAGDSHSLALDSEGRVWAWGRNDEGQLGRSGIAQSATPVQLPLLGITAIAAGVESSAAVKTDGLEAGTVWAWGVGYGPAPVFTGIADIQSIVDGWFSSAGIAGVTKEGTVHPWGVSTAGEWQVRDIISIPTARHAVGVDGTLWYYSIRVKRVLDDVVDLAQAWATWVSEPTGGVREVTWDGSAQRRYIRGPLLLTLADNAALGGDPDGDGLPTWRELREGTDPYDFDTNDDGVSDGVDLSLGRDPVSLDVDGDGISNVSELERGTDPFASDSDADGMNDDTDCFPLDPARSQCVPPDPTDITPPRLTLVAPRLSPVSVVPE